jgi:hypothetical protein
MILKHGQIMTKQFWTLVMIPLSDIGPLFFFVKPLLEEEKIRKNLCLSTKVFKVSRGFLKVLPGNSEKFLMIPSSVVDHFFFRVLPSLDGGKNSGKI